MIIIVNLRTERALISHRMLKCSKSITNRLRYQKDLKALYITMIQFILLTNHNTDPSRFYQSIRFIVAFYIL
ncbi:unnamed protein product [Rhizophagus irregularis]|nr:unnamed protein product [Rhizophagus irregularis]